MSVHPRRRRWSVQWWSVLWLTVVWVMLWGDLSIGTVIAGAAVGVVVTVLLPLPPIDFHGKVRPLYLAHLVLRFVVDLVVASFHVSALALRIKTVPRGAVVGVQLRNPADLYLTITANLSTLTPGSVVVEAHRLTGMLYLHVLDIEGSGGIEGIREQTLALEERVLRALASDSELAESGITPRRRRRSEVTP